MKKLGHFADLVIVWFVLTLMGLGLMENLFASIGYVTSGTGSASSGSTISVTVTITAGDTAVATIAEKPTTIHVSSITNGGTWTLSGAQTCNGTNLCQEIWTTGAGGASAASSVTINMSGTITDSTAVVADYSGVAAFGNTNSNTGKSTSETITLTTQNANNFALAGFSFNATGTCTASVGNVRNSINGVAENDCLMDNTGSTSVTNTTAAFSATKFWAARATELCATSPCTGSAAACSNYIALLGAGCK